VKRVLFYTHHNPQGYRIQQYFPFLEKRGFEVELLTTEANFLKVIERMRGAHAVYIQRLLFHPIKLSFIRAAARKIVYDFDDAVMYGDHGESPTRKRKFRSIVQAADAVFCGNRFLCYEAGQYRKDKVYYVPTVVDTTEYPVKECREADPLIVGWMGSRSTLPYLSSVQGSFLPGHSLHSLRLKIVADRAPDEMHETMIFEKWEKEKEKVSLLSFDVGIMPLKDDLWSRGKCGLKLIQYMASGLPSVAHPVGVAIEMIADGSNGFLRGETAEWDDALERLADDTRLRRRMGREARDRVEQDYSLHVWGPRVAEIIGGL